MTATMIAVQLVPALHAQGLQAEVAVQALPNGYGHKITIKSTRGQFHGMLVIYTGKQGPRYVVNELRDVSPDLLNGIEEAWQSLAFGSGTAMPTPTSALRAVEPGTIELWVDGACVQRPDGLKFGWAYVIQRDGQELTRHASHVVEPHMVAHRNVAAELQAVIHGLEQCRLMGHAAVTVFYDYTGLELWARGRWKANTQTTREYVRFITHCPLRVRWQKVPAHSGIPMNELVDELAAGAAQASSERFDLSVL